LANQLAIMAQDKVHVAHSSHHQQARQQRHKHAQKGHHSSKQPQPSQHQRGHSKAAQPHKIEKNIKISCGVDGRHIGRWFIGETLGKGGYSWVKKGIDRKNGRIVALKFMERRLTSTGEWKKSQQNSIKNEIETLKCLRHENIVRLLAYNLNAKYPDRTGKTRDVILLVLEYAAGGELFDILYYTAKLEPILARTYFRQLVAGISCMHDHGIIHRDIKPQNLLLDNKYNLKITDFGLSKIDPTGNSTIKMNDWHVGTRGYQAPEILLRKDYDKKVDIFAMGVVLFILLGGYPPFEHARENDKWYQFIATKKYKSFWKSHRNCGMRQMETDLITRMICFDPEKRITIAKLRRHQWFTSKEVLEGADLVKVLRYRHQEMERQRNADPQKQKILQNSVKRAIGEPLKEALSAAGKEKNAVPPSLPEDEMVNPHDIFTSKLNSAYEVLQGLEQAVLVNLKGNLMKPDYNEIADLEEIAERERDEEDENEEEATDATDDQKEEVTAKTDAKWDGKTYIDVVNFSLTFECALMDIEKMDGDHLVVVHIQMYRVDEANSNLVKFTRLSGPRVAFIKVIDVLSNVAGDYLTGLTDDAWKLVTAPDNANDTAKEDQQRIQELYKKCFPQSANEVAPVALEQKEVTAQ